MLAMASKKMAVEINKFFRTTEKFKGHTAIYQKGVDFWGNVQSVISIYYPAEFYAFPRDLDNDEITCLARRCDGTLAGFLEALADEIEI